MHCPVTKCEHQLPTCPRPTVLGLPNVGVYARCRVIGQTARTRRGRRQDERSEAALVARHWTRGVGRDELQSIVAAQTELQWDRATRSCLVQLGRILNRAEESRKGKRRRYCPLDRLHTP